MSQMSSFSPACHLIALEGIDGSGKSHMAHRLGRAIDRSMVVCEPSQGTVGQLIRNRLTPGSITPLSEGCLPWLFAADRKDLHDRLIGPAIHNGLVVISDRSVMSSLVYQSIDNELTLEQVWDINEGAFWQPDLVLYLDLPVEVAISRMDQRERKDRFEKGEFLSRARETYHDASDFMAGRGITVRRIDSSGSKDETWSLVCAAIAHAFPGLLPTAAIPT